MSVYILIDRKPVVVDPNNQEEVDRWAKWVCDIDNRIVKQEYTGNYLISTVFTGFNLKPFSHGEPALFETMVFLRNSNRESYHEHCYTWEQAEIQHETIVKLYSGVN